MELKLRQAFYDRKSYIHINRTRMELKPRLLSDIQAAGDNINRTRMELKPKSESQRIAFLTILIEPEWN